MLQVHPIHRVRRLEVAGPFILKIDFEDGVTRTIDFRPVLEGELYGPLRDVDLFNQVQIDPEAKTLVWPNGADFDPTTLHEWPEAGPRMAELARRWARTSAASKTAG
ncbi:MAG: DUF2442 domain-containing protein [Acidobacteria bacterium]|nr:DUF2442 domain-containing protein [Acidobacteriota bacterium]